MSNSTFIQIPVDIGNNPEELRRFLMRMVERLDIVLGFRGEASFTNNVEQAALADLVAYSQTMSASYDQAEAQAMSNAVTDLTDKVNTMLAALRAADIIGE